MAVGLLMLGILTPAAAQQSGQPPNGDAPKHFQQPADARPVPRSAGLRRSSLRVRRHTAAVPAQPIRRTAGEEGIQIWPANQALEQAATPATEPRQIHLNERSVLQPVETAQQPRRLPPTVPVYQPPAAPEKEPRESKAEVRCPEPHELIQPICALSLDIHPTEGDLPQECPLYFQYQPRCWCGTCFTWKASALCHKPLYFEQMALERYGHTAGHFVQPVISAAHFFATIPILPYKMGVESPCECIYLLGYCRPGSCAPKMIYRCPWSLRGALYQAGAVTGLVFLLP